MSILPNKYVSLDFSVLGVSAIIAAELRANDTVSTVWDRLAKNPRVRTFERFAAGLTLLFAARLVDVDRGILRTVSPTAPSDD